MSVSIFAPGLFRDQVAIITGGGTGIGLAVGHELGSLGAKIAICGRRVEPLEAAVAALREAGIEAHFGTADIRDPESIGAYLEGVEEALGAPDILVNNAGGQFPAPAQHISPKGFEAVVRNNLLGTWNFTHATANRFFIPQKRGRIVNVVAQVARGFPGMAHTGAARAGVINLTKSLAIEWAQHGVRVNAVAPGVIKTSGTKQYPPQLLEDAIKSTLLHRLGHEDEVSHLIVYLASRVADFVTGQTYYIDGGQSLWGDQWPVPLDIPKFPPYPFEE
ncbi:MAG: SDR family oxidoreductase [Sandaracinaceae bacterium]